MRWPFRGGRRARADTAARTAVLEPARRGGRGDWRRLPPPVTTVSLRPPLLHDALLSLPQYASTRPLLQRAEAIGLRRGRGIELLSTASMAGIGRASPQGNPVPGDGPVLWHARRVRQPPGHGDPEDLGEDLREYFREDAREDLREDANRDDAADGAPHPV